MDNLLKHIAGIVGDANVVTGELMSAHTTFRVGGPADYLVMPETSEQLRDVLAFCDTQGIAWRILGHGSNVLVADTGLRGVTVKLSGGLADVEVRKDGIVVAQAGASNAKVAAAAQRAGLSGFEFAAGIPGTIGGAAIMNAGAYEGEFSQVAQSVSCLTRDARLVELAADQAKWGYRSSAMMEAGHVVLGATLQLHEDDPALIRERMADLAHRRQEKQPLDVPSAGSTFKRPPGHYAGKLIQDAGLMGYCVGGAQVSTKHAGFVVNRGGASAADVLAVMRHVQDSVRREFGIDLELEVRLWGFE